MDIEWMKARILDSIEVNQETGCWLWDGTSFHPFGYGVCPVRLAPGRWRNMGAHRAAYVAFVGPIPNGMNVCHRCDVPACCRPEHLFLGSQRDNMRDMVAKGRKAVGVRNGAAKLTPESVRELRRRLGEGEKQVPLAREFGISQATLNDVWLGKTWKHVA